MSPNIFICAELPQTATMIAILWQQSY